MRFYKTTTSFTCGPLLQVLKPGDYHLPILPAVHPTDTTTTGGNTSWETLKTYRSVPAFRALLSRAYLSQTLTTLGAQHLHRASRPGPLQTSWVPHLSLCASPPSISLRNKSHHLELFLRPLFSFWRKLPVCFSLCHSDPLPRAVFSGSRQQRPKSWSRGLSRTISAPRPQDPAREDGSPFHSP